MSVCDAGVEIEHQEGIAMFIRDYERYGLVKARIVDGFMQILGAMNTWWLDLAEMSNRMKDCPS